MQLFCPIHGIPLQESVWTKSSRKNSNRNPRPIYGLQRYILLIQKIYACPSVQSHRYYSASQFVMEHPKVKTLALYFPFKKYHRSMYTVDLIEYIFTQIINGVSFLPIAESIAAMHPNRYVKNTGDINVAKFNNTNIYSYPSPDGIEATFSDVFNNLRDESRRAIALPAKSISVDHTFKVGKPIGGYQEQDNKFIKSCKRLFIVLKEESAVVAWELTNSTS